MKVSNSTETSTSSNDAHVSGDWRDLGRQLEKIFAEKMAAAGFTQEQKVLGVIKELVKEQITYENTVNSTRTFR